MGWSQGHADRNVALWGRCITRFKRLEPLLWVGVLLAVR